MGYQVVDVTFFPTNAHWTKLSILRALKFTKK